MDKFCEDCIHNEVCQYGAIPPHIGRCNDKDTLDDLIPRGEWIEGKYGTIKCNNCGCEIKYSYLVGNEPDFPKFCCDCGAKMLKGGSNG